MKEINFFGETTFRNQNKRFGIKTDDRRRHVYFIGKTGMGKTVAIKNMAIQDIQNGHGIGFVDPHGEASEELLDYIPASRINDVVYFNPVDTEYPLAFNVMESVDPQHRHLVASGLMGVFKKIWPDVWSARMEYILNNCILALLEYPGSTLLGVNRMLSDPDYRKKVVDRVTDPMVKAFWVNEFARYTQRLEVEATAAIQNKVGQFISAPLIRNIIGQVKSSIDLRKIMDEKKILIMDLSKGRIGEDNSRLLGALLITKLQLAAMSRVDIPEESRKDFYLYVDEFQNFATESFTNILSEARKYRLCLILAHQYITQMEETVRDAVFGNVGTLISFRVGADDAEFLEREFSPEFLQTDLVNLPKYNVYLKLMIDGVTGSAFSARTLAPLPRLAASNREKIVKVSRERYGTPRQVIEEKITKWTGSLELPAPRSTVPQERAMTLYDAKCALCGKWTKVIFPPDGTRPVYCKSCLKKKQGERTELQRPQYDAQRSEERIPEEKKELPLPSFSLSEAIKKEPVSFTMNKKPEERKKPKRKEVNLEELRKTLEESLGKVDQEKNTDENTEKT
ncbi:MAG: type IV secretion system DNA-binding domain-containing protein [Candidatus Pacebacteria bacterium]|nr:type IV secretion system DNA-binding domain-containing protein [Candidatus Paceibacterota bacterium]